MHLPILLMLNDEHTLILVQDAFREDEYIVIQVQDNGVGIARDKLSDIFMPFYSTKEKASGIGLSLVKQILRLHNASIHVQSVPGEGSTFTMKFQERSKYTLT